MKRRSALIALAALLSLQGGGQAQNQIEPAQDEQQESFEPAGDDPNDFWSRQPLPEESAPDEEGIFDPPGLPIIDPADVPEPVEGEEIPEHGSFGGLTVGDGAAPWQAQLYYPELTPKWQAQVNNGVKPWLLQHRCGGVLIARYWVLTAAHCVNGISMKYRIRLGAERLDVPGGWDYAIGRIIINDGRALKDRYAPFQGGDIALIYLVNDKNHPVPPSSQVRVATLSRATDVAPEAKVTAYGWGMRRQGGDITSANLLFVDLNILDRTKCAGSGIGKIDERVICARAATRKTCSNDSGGPLFNERRQLVGIVSGGGKYCQADTVPGVYTLVAYYMPWIKAQTGGAVQ